MDLVRTSKERERKRKGMRERERKKLVGVKIITGRKEKKILKKKEKEGNEKENNRSSEWRIYKKR